MYLKKYQTQEFNIIIIITDLFPSLAKCILMFIKCMLILKSFKCSKMLLRMKKNTLS